MTAAEIIALINQLPSAEREAIRAFLASESSRGQVEEIGSSYGEGARELRYMSLREAEGIAEGVFDRHPELFRKLAQ